MHGLRNNLRVDDLKVFVLDEASFLYDFPNCFFKVCCFKGFQGICFVVFCAQTAHMVKLQADELMSRGFKEQTKQKKKWFRDVSSAFVNNGCHFGLRIHRIQMM